ncbi:MAG: hypothetical protein EOP42_30935 [Sphingobacteriaceae bacterium]|nr:MAG: hypothetical protein EOP42_30935 [Sphingobacteriaceae bacterium]
MKTSTKKIFTITALCGFSFVCGAFITQKLENSPITVAVVNEAEKLTGIDFSTAQADSMLTGLSDHRKAYEELRKLHLDNSVVPALNFNPIPVGFDYPDKTNGFLLDKRSITQMPSDKNELAFYTIRQLLI